MSARSVSIFFFAGDFAEVLRRHDKGEPQVYATHPEVAKLVTSLADRGVRVTIYRYWSDDRRVEEPRNNVKIIALNAQRVGDNSLLRAALADDSSEVLIPHFPNLDFVNACMQTGRPVMLAMANSYNRTGPRGYVERRKLAKVLNDARLLLVANHCWPSAMKLAEYGVDANKLLAWDVPKMFSPDQFEPRSRSYETAPLIVYAGVINEQKGVGDLLHAIGILKKRGIILRAKLAGSGDLDAMNRLVAKLRIEDQVTFLGRIPNPEVIELFRSSDLIAVPSRHSFPEGFPLALFEAIASRTPIVCSDHPMFFPILGTNDRAGIFRQRNPKSFADAIERLLTNQDLYAKMSRTAEDSWSDLQRSVDWKTLIDEFVTNGASSKWIRQRTFNHLLASSRALASAGIYRFES